MPVGFFPISISIRKIDDAMKNELSQNGSVNVKLNELIPLSPQISPPNTAVLL